MAVDKLVDSAQLDADLTSVANAIRTKGGTSGQLAFPADFVSAVEAIPTGGGSLVTGTFSPASNLRSVTLTDCIGKQNLMIKVANTVSAAPVSRTHCFDLFINGMTKLSGSSNSSGNAWSVNMGWGQETYDGTQASWDPATGVVTIDAGVSSNYGGYYAAGMTYMYVAW